MVIIPGLFGSSAREYSGFLPGLFSWRTKVIIALEFFYCKIKHLLSPCIAGGFIKDAIQKQALYTKQNVYSAHLSAKLC